jgi:diguanylate cyclase (GGDEF)-like protein
MLDPTEDRLSQIPIRTTLIYLVLAAVWVAASDNAVEALGLGRWAQTAKGWAFVVVSSLALFLILRALVTRVRRSEPAHDALTRLPNRSLFARRVAEAIPRARADNHPLAVVGIGLDRFRTLNDTLGNQVGDAILVRSAERIEGTLRAVDTLGRVGGDEFAVLQHGVRNADDAAALAQRVLAAISAPMTIDGQQYRMTASIGVAMFPSDGETGDDLIQKADLALTRAKQEGRDTYRFFVPAMDEAARERARLESGLHRALEENQFRLHFQPQVDLRTGRVIGVEGLVRWEHPDEGLVPPARFLPIAEELGLIRPIGQWVLQAGLTRAERWRRAGLAFGRLSVNLSFGQFRQRELYRRVSELLQDSGLPPEMLELELTESMLAHEPARASETLRELHDLGLSLAIDDFGTGYSSLSYLQQFPVQVLKIDKSFTAGIGTDRGAEAIVHVIIGLARTLGLRTLAEGVETPEQTAFLRDAGCDGAQGYLYSAPLTEEALTDFLRKTSAS